MKSKHWSQMSDEERSAMVAENLIEWKPSHAEGLCDGTRFLTCKACGEHGHGNCIGDGTNAVDVLCGASGVFCCPEAEPPQLMDSFEFVGDILAILRERIESGKQFYVQQFMTDLQRLSPKGYPYWMVYLEPDIIAFAALRAIGVEVEY